MAESDFTLTGLKLATATWDPPVSDRYMAVIRASNSNGHNGASGTLTLRTNNANAFYEIPDAPGAAAQPHFEYRVPAFG